MSPKEFDWSAEQQVVVTNPTSDTFRFQVHSKWYEVAAGKTVKMPGFIAWSYVYKLAVKMALAANEFNKWNEDGVHQRYYDKIVVTVEETIQSVSVAEETVHKFSDDDNGDDMDTDLEDLDLGDDEEADESDDSEEESGDDQSEDKTVKPMRASNGKSRKNRRR